MSKMLSRIRTEKWNRLVEDAALLATVDERGEAAKLSVSVDLILEMDRYISRLHDDLLNKTMIVGFGSSSHEDKGYSDSCTHCGLPIEGGKVMSNNGRFHPYCFGKTKSRKG